MLIFAGRVDGPPAPPLPLPGPLGRVDPMPTRGPAPEPMGPGVTVGAPGSVVGAVAGPAAGDPTGAPPGAPPGAVGGTAGGGTAGAAGAPGAACASRGWVAGPAGGPGGTCCPGTSDAVAETAATSRAVPRM